MGPGEALSFGMGPGELLSVAAVGVSARRMITLSP